MKKQSARSFQNSFLDSRTEEFEHSVAAHFFAHYKKILVLHNDYTDWLIHCLRKTEKFSGYLAVTYLTNKQLDSLSEEKRFFRLLQFMSFARGLPSYKKELCQQEYRVITFKLTNFMDYIQIKNRNQYQREQVKNFFYDIQQSNQFASQFSERVFQSSAVFPFIRVEQENDTYGALIIHVAIVKELYFYSHPFYFPRYFQSYNSVYDLQVKLQIIYNLLL
jgi:hypothetical protein